MLVTWEGGGMTKTAQIMLCVKCGAQLEKVPTVKLMVELHFAMDVIARCQSRVE